MTTEQIKDIQRKIGTVPDGIWGAKSNAACRAYLMALMPTPNPWPKADEKSMIEFYGRPGDESNLISMHVGGFSMKYDGQPVTRIRCHKRVAESLGRILHAISETPHKWILERYAGCYNNRAMRGGSRTSKHAWGIAIDLAPDANGMKTPWPQAADMPFEVMEIFAREGWVGLGWSDNRDAMHMEAVRY